jgi:tetratricopeptide (TPR) repeat protein
LARGEKELISDYHEFASFGMLLKAFRMRRNLVQQQLAAALGVHRHTLSRWEQGDFLPASKALVLELARHLHLDEQETRQLLEASLTALAPYWHVPLPRNPFFTGREEILAALHTHLTTDQMVALTQSYALHGLGGIGKTQLALEYAYRHALEYSAVFWIEAETGETAISNLLRMAEVLQLPERQETDQQRVVTAVQRWLSSHSRWLLIWDNLEDLELLPRLLPAVRQGVILLTTRCQTLGTLARGVPLCPMEPEEGLRLLLRRAKALEPEATSGQIRQFAMRAPGEYAAAETLVTAMGGLPLALDQAGAYIEETGCGVSDYLQRYEQQRVHVLDWRGGTGGNHPHSVTTTFKLAIERVEQEQGAAAELLYLCAFLHAEAIPEELFVAGDVHLEPEQDRFCTNLVQFDRAIAVLRRVSLVQRQPETHTLSLHRLVQAVLRESLSEQEQARWLKRATAILNTAFPEVTPRTWEQCERLLPHVLTVEAALPESAEDQELAEALYKAARYLYDRARYKQAEPLGQRALRIGQQIWGPEHPQVASMLCDLAYLYYELGHYQQAEPLFQRALCIWEHVLGPAHPALVRPLNGLGALYWKQGKYDQAEQAYQRACSILEQAPGGEHPRVADLLNGLALLAVEQGKYQQAEYFYQRALAIREHLLGREHPDTAQSLNNLADLYVEQGKYQQAESLCQQALGILKQVLGPENPDLAYPLRHLADLYLEQGKYQQAESCYQQVVHLWEQALGSDYPELAYPFHGLAILATRQGKYQQAESWYQQALHLWEQTLGPEHPQVAHPLNNLAALYSMQGKDEQAKQLFQRARSIREKYLSPHHPELAQTLHDLAVFHLQQGRLDEGITCAERALAIRLQSLGDAHPKTVATRMLCAQLVQEQGRLEAEASSSGHQTDPRTRAKGQEHLPIHVMNIAVRGGTEQVVYTRHVKMREVTFTCTICGQTVTQLHYPSGRIKYCSEACRAVRSAQIQEERVRKQREKRRNEREAHLRTRQEENL